MQTLNKKPELLYYPNKLLNVKADPFDFANPIMDPKEIEDILVTEMAKRRGLGLAATQMGINAQVFVMGSDLKFMALFNPVILEQSTETCLDIEGCLSFPGVSLYVERPVQIHLQFTDKEQKTYNYWVKGLDCKICAHEIDHLNGLTFKDKVSPFKWARAKKKLKA